MKTRTKMIAATFAEETNFEVNTSAKNQAVISRALRQPASTPEIYTLRRQFEMRNQGVPISALHD